jgi:hypothetical protein
VIDLSHLKGGSEQNLEGYSFECSSLFMVYMADKGINNREQQVRICCGK